MLTELVIGDNKKPKTNSIKAVPHRSERDATRRDGTPSQRDTQRRVNLFLAACVCHSLIYDFWLDPFRFKTPYLDKFVSRHSSMLPPYLKIIIHHKYTMPPSLWKALKQM